MKNLVLLGVVVAAIYYWHSHRQAARTGVPAYNEIRMEFKADSRSIELVSYVQRDSSESCEEIRVWWVESMFKCAASTHCTVLKNQCVDDVPTRYKNMFSEKPSITTYLKAENASLARQGVTLFWGLSDDEAAEACKQISQGFKRLAEANPDIKYRCI